MADNTLKFENNIPGKYYVDTSCIGCTLCAEIAPDNFKINSSDELDMEHDYVFKQPETGQEEALCAEAMNACPGNAIGDDGDV